ncbi:sensor histidine kinase, partial [Steroidobacter sp.]|uniref:sensor histidine kinase n=1 Tax=Steroidobacter sp. TaxID=1978227 RepID=UPI001A528D4E
GWGGTGRTTPTEWQTTSPDIDILRSDPRFVRNSRPIPSVRLRSSFVLWLSLLWWTAYAILFASQVMTMNEQAGQPIGWPAALKYSFGGWMTWVPLTLGIVWLVRRHPIERGSITKSAAVLSLGVLAVIFLRGAYVYVTNPIFDWYEALPSFSSVLLTSLSNNLMMAWTVVAVAHALVFYERARDRERRLAEVERSLVTTQLEALRSRLHPHFLFNALNSVAEIVHADAELADRMLVSLSTLLRESLRADERLERTLRDELVLVNHYLTIESIRLGRRLEVHIDIPETCMNALVPTLILQPLVENAIVHAIARRRATGRLTISAAQQGQTLHVEISNSRGPEGGRGDGNGVGLELVTRRLELMYGSQGSLERRDTDREIYTVVLKIPVRVATLNETSNVVAPC